MSKNLLHEFFNSRSDVSPLEASEQEKLEKEFDEWLSHRTESFDSVTRPVIKYLAENYSPHTAIIIENDRATLYEGRAGFTTDDYLED